MEIQPSALEDSFSELLSFCQLPGSNCDWNYWRQQAFENLSVPASYFDFGLERKISGSYRYLEIISQFELIVQSVVKVRSSNGKGDIFGLYEVPKAFRVAVRQRNSSFLIWLLQNFGEQISTFEIRLSLTFLQKEGRGLSIEKILLDALQLRTVELLPKFSPNPLLLSIDEGDFASLSSIPNLPFSILLTLAERPSQQAFEIAFHSYQSLAESSRRSKSQTLRWQMINNYVLFLGSVIRSGNIENVERVLSVYGTPEFSPELLKAAYFSGRLQLIEIFSPPSSDLDIESNEKVRLLVEGYWLHPNPIELFNIVKQMPITPEQALILSSLQNIDILQLLDIVFLDNLEKFFPILSGNIPVVIWLTQKILQFDEPERSSLLRRFRRSSRHLKLTSDILSGYLNSIQ